MRSLAYLFAVTVTMVPVTACGPSANNGDDDGPCENRCTSFGWEECLSPGNYQDPVVCAEDEVCTPEYGCRVCYPGTRYCASETEVWQCNDDGNGGTPAETCQGEDVCSNGVCKTPCERAMDLPSNVGCEFWAADLDNEAVTTFGITNDAAAQQYSVAIANNNDYPVDVRVYRNAARVGDPLAEEMVTEVTVPGRDLVQVDLPQREVDGCMGQNGAYAKGSGSHTFVSPHAYHIRTTGPVTAYQFNPIVQQYSNDASVLIPIQTLRSHYYVLGWPTTNPCGPPMGDPLYMESIPDRTSITIIGIEPDTQVTVMPTHPIAPSGGDSGFDIPATDQGVPLQFTVNPYDVVNLESDQPTVSIQQCFNYLDRDGDFTGTVVTSSKPIAVFSSLERGSGTGGAEPPEPPNWDGEGCCTEHMEEQMLPTVALGWRFAISRSPKRSTSSYVEPDIYRVLATVDGTVINTSLPAPYAQFTLNAGEFKAFHAYAGFTLEATGGAVMVGQYLVSQGLTDGGIGDPSFTTFPAAEQHRSEYVFLVPTTWQDNYMVLAMPTGATVFIDGQALGEFNDCVQGDIGDLAGLHYVQLTCPLAEGVHTVTSNQPVGLSVYGYYSVGAYSYAGGSNVNIINPIE